MNGHRAAAPLRGGRQRLAIYCDRNGLEVFASNGLTYVPMLFLPKADDLSLAVQVQGGLARMASLDVYELKSIWPAGSGTPKAPKVPATAAQQIRRGTLGPPHNKP